MSHVFFWKVSRSGWFWWNNQIQEIPKQQNLTFFWYKKKTHPSCQTHNANLDEFHESGFEKKVISPKNSEWTEIGFPRDAWNQHSNLASAKNPQLRAICSSQKTPTSNGKSIFLKLHLLGNIQDFFCSAILDSWKVDLFFKNQGILCKQRAWLVSRCLTATAWSYSGQTCHMLTEDVPIRNREN